MNRKLKQMVLGISLALLVLAIGYRVYEGHIYANGNEKAENGEYEKAKKEFEKIPFFRDSKKRIDEMVEKETEEDKLKKQYKKAVEKYKAGEYSSAKKKFEQLGDYLDSQDYFSKCENQINNSKENAYKQALRNFNEGNYAEALVGFEVLENYKDSIAYAKKCRNIIERLELSHTIYAGIRYSLLISDSSAVVIEGDSGGMDVDELGDAVSVAGKGAFVIGLSNDGRVSMTGKDEIYNVNVREWENYEFLAIDAGQHYAVGLTTEHQVVHTGRNDEQQKECENWKDIKMISSSARHIAAIASDGKVYIAGYQAQEQQKQIDGQEEWDNLVSIAAGGGIKSDCFTVGLKSDGTLVFAGKGQICQNIKATVSRNKELWTGIKAIAAGNRHIIGITKDNRVLMAGDGSTRQLVENVPDWENVVAVSAGDGLTLGLLEDNHVNAVGKEHQGQLGALDWTDILIRSEWPWIKQ